MNAEMIKKLGKGDKVRVLPHTSYQHLSKGTVIDPMIEHEMSGYETTVRAIYKDVMEDEHGNAVTEYEIEVATGEIFSPEQIELIRA